MQNWLLDSLFESTVAQIAAGRKVDAAKVKDWIDNRPYIAEEAKEKGLMDAIEHIQDFEKGLKDKFGEKGVVDLIGVMGYYQLVSMLLNVDRYPLPQGAKPELQTLK